MSLYFTKTKWLAAAFLLCLTWAGPDVALAQRVDTDGDGIAKRAPNETAEAVLLATNLSFSLVNAFTLTQGKGSAWAAPLGMLTGLASILYEASVEEGNEFVVATGMVSVVFGGLSLYRWEDNKKKGNNLMLTVTPHTGVGPGGATYHGLRADLFF
jgi:hypothetical protein